MELSSIFEKQQASTAALLASQEQNRGMSFRIDKVSKADLREDRGVGVSGAGPTCGARQPRR
jgi:hypothetical protein